MFDRIIRRIARTRNGVALLTGAAAMLSGVERVLSSTRSGPPPIHGRFRIYRSDSGLGYSYWVLRGSGSFDCFVLFDRWEQAIQEAERRIAVARRAAQVQPAFLVPSVR